MGEGTEVEGIYIEKVEKPWLFPRCCWVFDGESCGEGWLVVVGEFPDDELVVFAMPLRRLEVCLKREKKTTWIEIDIEIEIEDRK